MRYLALAAGVLLSFAAPVQTAEQYPQRPVRMLVPYAPGGATDIVARDISPKLQEALGQPFVVDNRAGASGNIAVEAAAKAMPDGYTLLVGNVSTNAINESTFDGVMQARPSRDLVGISRLVEIPHVLVATPSFPPNSVTELIEWARRNPGKLNYASAGIGTYPQLDMLRLLKAAGIDATHIPYKGGAAQELPALLSGEVQVAFINLASTIEQIKAGRLKALATTRDHDAVTSRRSARCSDDGRAGFPRHRHQRLAGAVRPGGDAQADHRPTLRRGRRHPVAAGDEGDARAADDDRRAFPLAAAVYRTGPRRDACLGGGRPRQQGQDRVAFR
jgi:tripartite-type tricarboxylate transporter receptor subunit TctC